LQHNYTYTSDLETVEWNVEGKNTSYEGHYIVEKGYPSNPLGRTGIFGKGNFKEFGPNFISIPIVTRFQMHGRASSLDTPLEVLVKVNQKNEVQLPEVGL